MIFEKRGRWCYRDPNGKLHKFSSEEAAREYAGEQPAPVQNFHETIETPVITEENFSEFFEHENPVTENGQDWKDWSPEEM